MNRKPLTCRYVELLQARPQSKAFWERREVFLFFLFLLFFAYSCMKIKLGGGIWQNKNGLEYRNTSNPWLGSLALLNTIVRDLVWCYSLLPLSWPCGWRLEPLVRSLLVIALSPHSAGCSNWSLAGSNYGEGPQHWLRGSLCSSGGTPFCGVAVKFNQILVLGGRQIRMAHTCET